MANSAFLRSLISNPNKITTNFILKPSPTLITRPFSSSKSNPRKVVTTIDPFCKESMNQKKLVEDYFKARTEGLFVTGARKVFERMSKRFRMFDNNNNNNNNNKKLTNEAITKPRIYHDRTPEVVAHIAVVEAYANAGQTNHSAYQVYLKMLGPGVIPNQTTYNKLIQLLVSISGGDWMMVGQAQKYLLEMLDKGMTPDAATSVAIFKALAKEGRVREGKEFLGDLKRKGFLVDHEVFREVLKGRGMTPVKLLQGKNGHVLKTVLEILFDQKI